MSDSQYRILNTELNRWLAEDGGFVMDPAEARLFPTKESAEAERLRRAPVSLLREEVVHVG